MKFSPDREREFAEIERRAGAVKRLRAIPNADDVVSISLIAGRVYVVLARHINAMHCGGCGTPSGDRVEIDVSADVIRLALEQVFADRAKDLEAIATGTLPVDEPKPKKPRCGLGYGWYETEPPRPMATEEPIGEDPELQRAFGAPPHDDDVEPVEPPRPPVRPQRVTLPVDQFPADIRALYSGAFISAQRDPNRPGAWIVKYETVTGASETRGEEDWLRKNVPADAWDVPF